METDTQKKKEAPVRKRTPKKVREENDAILALIARHFPKFPNDKLDAVNRVLHVNVYEMFDRTEEKFDDGEKQLLFQIASEELDRRQKTGQSSTIEYLNSRIFVSNTDYNYNKDMETERLQKLAQKRASSAKKPPAKRMSGIFTFSDGDKTEKPTETPKRKTTKRKPAGEKKSSLKKVETEQKLKSSKSNTDKRTSHSREHKFLGSDDDESQALVKEETEHE